MRRRIFAITTIAGSLMLACVLGLYGTSAAQTQPTVRPFADSQGKRVDTVDLLRQVVTELKKQNEMLKEQNDFLKSGKLKVVTR